MSYRHRMPVGTVTWKQASHTWRAFEKTEGTLARMNDGTGNAPLQSAETVLVWGPSLSERMAAVCGNCPDTQSEQAGLTECGGA